MRYLLDTQAFIWFAMGSPRLSLSARRIMEDLSNELLLSIASIWEAAIKLSIGKLTLGAPLDVIFSRELVVNRLTLLNLSLEHVYRVASLPMHHRDPFDRMQLEQNPVVRFRAITQDGRSALYDVCRVW